MSGLKTEYDFYSKLYIMSIITIHNGILVQLMAKTINEFSYLMSHALTDIKALTVF